MLYFTWDRFLLRRFLLCVFYSSSSFCLARCYANRSDIGNMLWLFYLFTTKFWAIVAFSFWLCTQLGNERKANEKFKSKQQQQKNVTTFLMYVFWVQLGMRFFFVLCFGSYRFFFVPSCSFRHWICAAL